MFEVSRFEKVFTFQNVLVHEAIQSLPKMHIRREPMLDYLRSKIGDFVEEGDLLAMRYLFRFVSRQGVVPDDVVKRIKNHRSGFILMCWDILQKNEYDYEHPLARLARKYVNDYQKHIEQVTIVQKHVDELIDDLFGEIPINQLGKYDLEEAMRSLGIVFNNCVFFPCAKKINNFIFLTGEKGKPTGSILMYKDNNTKAVLTMDFN